MKFTWEAFDTTFLKAIIDAADVEDKEAGRLSTKSRIVEYDFTTNTFSSKEFSGKKLNFSYSYSG